MSYPGPGRSARCSAPAVPEGSEFAGAPHCPPPAPQPGDTVRPTAPYKGNKPSEELPDKYAHILCAIVHLYQKQINSPLLNELCCFVLFVSLCIKEITPTCISLLEEFVYWIELDMKKCRTTFKHSHLIWETNYYFFFFSGVN